VVLQWCYSGVTVVLQGHSTLPALDEVTHLSQGCYSGVTVVLQWGFSSVTGMLELCYTS
jgi:hypothetical protein